MLAGLLCRVAPDFRAEVSVVRWQPYRSISSIEILDSTGDVREDGSPDVSYHQSTHRPYVFWADPSWVGVETMRKIVRRNLLVAADAVDIGP